MGDDEEMKTWAAEIPAWKADKASEALDYGEKREIFEEVADIIINEGWDHRSAYLVEARRRRRRREKLKEERDHYDRRVSQEEEIIERLHQKAEEQPDPREEYLADLEDLEHDLRSGMHVTPGLSRVETMASNHGMTPEDIIDDLERRNPDVPSKAFDRPNLISSSELDTWGGFDTDEMIEKPVEERE